MANAEKYKRGCYWQEGVSKNDPRYEAIVGCEFRKPVEVILGIAYKCAHKDQRASGGACPPWDENNEPISS